MNQTTGWAGLGGFAQGLSEDQLTTAFNDAVGGAYFEPGVHNVTIVGSSDHTSATGSKSIKLEFEGPNGESMRGFIKPQGRDKAGNPTISKRLSAVFRAVIKDPVLLMEFVREVNVNPSLFGAFTGLKLRIEVVPPKRGFRVDAVGEAVKVVDIETGEGYPELQDYYESFSEAKEAAKAADKRQGYNEIGNFIKGSDDDIAANEEAIRQALRTAQENVSSIAAKKSAAGRPASI